MPAIKKILFPVDFSDRCRGAARYVEALAGRFEAELILLHVVVSGTNVLAEELLPRRQAELDAFLADELKYFTTRRVCVAGDPAAKIVETARSWGAGLVMMPTHGLGLFRRLLLGSVTAKVLHDLDCPIWTGIHSEEAPPLERITCRRVLCALDLGERSRHVLEWAAALAGEYQASLEIVHAAPSIDAAARAGVMERELGAAFTAEAARRIAAIQEAAGTDAAVVVEGGEPAKVVTGAAKDFHADLMVIGRHGGVGLAGLLRHNAYAILRESPCPVISI
jgi:nucleotide-binding universal stress UspA family protein